MEFSFYRKREKKGNFDLAFIVFTWLESQSLSYSLHTSNTLSKIPKYSKSPERTMAFVMIKCNVCEYHILLIQCLLLCCLCDMRISFQSHNITIYFFFVLFPFDPHRNHLCGYILNEFFLTTIKMYGFVLASKKIFTFYSMEHKNNNREKKY